MTNRDDKSFSLSQLNFTPMGKNFSPAPSKQQLIELEQHFGHPLPANLIEIFKHYNGSRPSLSTIGENANRVINYFYSLSDNVDDAGDIWNVINGFKEDLGPETLPFAEGLYNEVYYLKWVNGESQVWSFLYGTIALEVYDEDEFNDWDGISLPTITFFLTDSFDDLLVSFAT